VRGAASSAFVVALLSTSFAHTGLIRTASHLYVLAARHCLAPPSKAFGNPRRGSRVEATVDGVHRSGRPSAPSRGFAALGGVRSTITFQRQSRLCAHDARGADVDGDPAVLRGPCAINSLCRRHAMGEYGACTALLLSSISQSRRDRSLTFRSPTIASMACLLSGVAFEEQPAVVDWGRLND
jgi:hypothetical protein